MCLLQGFRQAVLILLAFVAYPCPADLVWTVVDVINVNVMFNSQTYCQCVLSVQEIEDYRHNGLCSCVRLLRDMSALNVSRHHGLHSVGYFYLEHRVCASLHNTQLACYLKL